jgi:hypothetical protein
VPPHSWYPQCDSPCFYVPQTHRWWFPLFDLMRSVGPGRCLIVFNWFYQLCCNIANSVVPFFPFQGFFCRCYKCGATTTIITIFILFYICSLAVARFYWWFICKTTSGLLLPKFTELVIARVLNKEKLWLFQVFALTAGLYGCQAWATSSLTYASSKTTPAYVLNLAC